MLPNLYRHYAIALMAAYYNENDPYAAQWLRNLIQAGHIAPGDVDERSIVDVRSYDLRGYGQCHFFAGISGWSLALRLVGWPDDRPVWTASVPANRTPLLRLLMAERKATAITAIFGQYFFPIARECHPPVLFGEQVSAAIKWGWWDRAALDLEGASYAAASAVLRADAVGADHERKRLYWLAYTDGERWQGHQSQNGISVAAAPPFAINGDSLVERGVPWQAITPIYCLAMGYPSKWNESAPRASATRSSRKSRRSSSPPASIAFTLISTLGE